MRARLLLSLLLLALASSVGAYSYGYYTGYYSGYPESFHALRGPIELDTPVARLLNPSASDMFLANVTASISFDRNDATGVLRITDPADTSVQCSCALTPVSTCVPAMQSPGQFIFQVDDTVGEWPNSFLACVALNAVRGSSFGVAMLTRDNDESAPMSFELALNNPDQADPVWNSLVLSVAGLPQSAGSFVSCVPPSVPPKTSGYAGGGMGLSGSGRYGSGSSTGKSTVTPPKTSGYAAASSGYAGGGMGLSGSGRYGSGSSTGNINEALRPPLRIDDAMLAQMNESQLRAVYASMRLDDQPLPEHLNRAGLLAMIMKESQNKD